MGACRALVVLVCLAALAGWSLAGCPQKDLNIHGNCLTCKDKPLVVRHVIMESIRGQASRFLNGALGHCKDEAKPTVVRNTFQDIGKEITQGQLDLGQFDLILLDGHGESSSCSPMPTILDTNPNNDVEAERVVLDMVRANKGEGNNLRFLLLVCNIGAAFQKKYKKVLKKEDQCTKGIVYFFKSGGLGYDLYELLRTPIDQWISFGRSKSAQVHKDYGHEGPVPRLKFICVDDLLQKDNLVQKKKKLDQNDKLQSDNNNNNNNNNNEVQSDNNNEVQRAQNKLTGGKAQSTNTK